VKRLTPLKAIRKFCLECAGTNKEVESCTANEAEIRKAREQGDMTNYSPCFLYEFRFGKNPARKGIGGKGWPKIEAKTPTQDGFQGE